MICYFISGYLFAPLLIRIYFRLLIGTKEKLLGIKHDYAIQERYQTKRFKGYWKGLFPVLLGTNLALMLYNNELLITILLPGWTTFGYAFRTFYGLMPYTVGIGFAAFTPAWFILDSGIVYSNNKENRDTTNPIELKSVGGEFNSLLKGYAGISVIISFIFIVYNDFILDYIKYPTLMSLFNIIGLPLTLLWNVLIVISIIIIMDSTYESRKRYIRKTAKKMGVVKFIREPVIENLLTEEINSIG
ncbi:MAG: hypothetical protein EU547_04635 [Promethearchaeota archaeon]|nr:MAG: hypothetical protein EU547_04635 [Candidatus Lokiarchaeota archaeon]